MTRRIAGEDNLEYTIDKWILVAIDEGVTRAYERRTYICPYRYGTYQLVHYVSYAMSDNEYAEVDTGDETEDSSNLGENVGDNETSDDDDEDSGDDDNDDDGGDDDIEPAPPPLANGFPEKLAAQDGKGGSAWDDGSDHDGVTKIYVRSGGDGIQFVKFDYVKAGQPKQGTLHGEQSRGLTTEIVISHPEEYLVSVEGWYDSIILGIQFKTNLKTSQLIGYEFDGSVTKFNLQVQDKKIIGFHGFASTHLNSIGAYFVPKSSTSPPSTPVKKLEAKGGDSGAVWDDSSHDNVKKVYVGQAQDGIGAVKFEYFNGSQVTIGNEHGKPTLLGFDEFELESDEYLTSVEGTYDKILGAGSGIVTRLIFKTNKNKTAGPFGLEGSTHFEFKEEGYKIAGFHGRAGETINSVGVYLAPVGTIPLTPARHL